MHKAKWADCYYFDCHTPAGSIKRVKRCRKCDLLKELTDFYAMKGMKDGYRHDCKVCNLAAKKARYEVNPAQAIARVKKWQDENPDRHRETQRRLKAKPEYKARARDQVLRKKYGIGQAEYEVMLAAQGGVCAICGWPPAEGVSLHVDHDHGRTGRVRALLCVKCNNALGQFNEDPMVVEQAAEYLWRHMTLQRLLALKEA